MLLPFCWSPFGWSATLPADLKWESNDTDPVYADRGQAGGTFRDFMSSFPLTLRKYGPDSNGGFAAYVRETNLPLLSTHPVTRNPIPMLANQWAFGADNKTLYFRINPKARWSDGQPVTADDWVFTLKMMRSKEINDPWYNNYYSTQISEVTKFDDHTLAITSGTEKSREDLLEASPFTPEPSHAIKLTANWVKEYNWKVLPVTGPTRLASSRRASRLPSTGSRIGGGTTSATSSTASIRIASRSRCSGIRTSPGSTSCAVSSTPSLVMPNWWHDKSKTAEFEKGYIERLWFYNQTPQPHGALSQHGRSLAEQSRRQTRHPARPRPGQDDRDPAAGGLPASQHL
jgi:microcin C transport system substrate-binding protein